MILVNFINTATQFEKEVNSVLKQYGLTMAQYTVLTTLKAHESGSLTIGSLKEASSVLNSDVTRMLDRLASKNYVIRKRCEKNRRRIYVSITESGIKDCKNIDNRLMKLDSAFLSNRLDTDEMSVFEQLLYKLTETKE